MFVLSWNGFCASKAHFLSIFHPEHNQRDLDESVGLISRNSITSLSVLISPADLINPTMGKATTYRSKRVQISSTFTRNC